MLPTYAVIGAAKCGTTSLCDLLGAHPDVFMTCPREPHYFSRITTFDSGREGYESLFAHANGHAARGEGSTSYSHPNRIEFTAPRLRDIVPDCRLIYIVRDPIRRLESDWKMRRREKRALPDINRAVEADATLLTFGLYWRYLSVYRRFFRDEQILVVFLDDLARDPISTMMRVYAHIGVDPMFRPRDVAEARNAATGRRTLSGAGSFIWRLPGVGHAKRVVPTPVYRRAQRLLTRKHHDTATWEPQVLRAVNDLYRADSQQLLEYCGKRQGDRELGHWVH